MRELQGFDDRERRCAEEVGARFEGVIEEARFLAATVPRARDLVSVLEEMAPTIRPIDDSSAIMTHDQGDTVFVIRGWRPFPRADDKWVYARLRPEVLEGFLDQPSYARDPWEHGLNRGQAVLRRLLVEKLAENYKPRRTTTEIKPRGDYL